MNKDEQAFLLGKIRDELIGPDGHRDLGESIGRLLDLHLEELDDWRYCFVDGLLDMHVDFRDGRAVVLACVVSGKSDGKYWMDPLQAVFLINRQGRVTRYELRFGDLDCPNELYKLRRRYEPSQYHNSAYRFTLDDG